MAVTNIIGAMNQIDSPGGEEDIQGQLRNFAGADKKLSEEKDEEVNEKFKKRTPPEHK